MSPSAGQKDKLEITFEMIRIVIAHYTSGVDPLDMTWARVQTIMRTIPFVKLLQKEGKLTPAQHVAMQRMQDEA